MQVTTYNFEELVDLARSEITDILTNDTLQETHKKQIRTMFDAFLHLYDVRSNWRYDNTFNMIINDIPSELYNQFQLIGKKLNIPLHRLFSVIMEETLRNDDLKITAKTLKMHYRPKSKYSINHHKNLEITDQDLLELDSPVQLNHIKHLKIKTNVDEALFIDKIQSINHCKYIELPSHISKLVSFLKIQFSDEISFY